MDRCDPDPREHRRAPSPPARGSVGARAGRRRTRGSVASINGSGPRDGRSIGPGPRRGVRRRILVADGQRISFTHPLLAVSPSFGFTSPGGSVQFTATVTGTTDQRVNWSVGGSATITSTCLFTAPAAAADGDTFDVIARSIADPTSFGGAPVQIVAEDVSGNYRGQHCFPSPVIPGRFVCGNPISISYTCGGRSQRDGAVGRFCHWLQPFAGTVINGCFIEVVGDKFGGPFTGAVVRCSFAQPPIPLSRFRMEGSVGRGRLTATVFAHDFQQPGEVVLATYDLAEVAP